MLIKCNRFDSLTRIKGLTATDIETPVHTPILLPAKSFSHNTLCAIKNHLIILVEFPSWQASEMLRRLMMPTSWQENNSEFKFKDIYIRQLKVSWYAFSVYLLFNIFSTFSRCTDELRKHLSRISIKRNIVSWSCHFEAWFYGKGTME